MKRTFKLRVFDKAGTLNRLTSLFVRRQINIVSITATPTLEEGISEITFIAEVPDDEKQRTIIQQLEKQVNTLLVQDITSTNSFNRELLLIKLKKPYQQSILMQVIEPYDALVSVLKEDGQYTFIQATGPQYTLNQLLDDLSSFQIEQVARTGTAAII
ncbi:acetolactate synthase small subunit [Staphylococcus coagulans]|uniref:acetolactate synthase small subunit n=1 Tax=Staphylococcus coagulans TaxID=74706 RepID=UPI001BE99CBB|nr:acetolactate synthase small subunit [Staphylococcus coagulans]MBT2830759.1 acetolactate synthase small subunit [Staphylococcus coagulans]MBT2860410.1 acetolactate synthase small subunit [Staphylococcus coagulans]MBU3873439.1 acetolactate synthase small subunit [Staphylococcus coagulans]UNB49331.1 acetolactate synthase small subunit [Staphylococcus coagulans]